MILISAKSVVDGWGEVNVAQSRITEEEGQRREVDLNLVHLEKSKDNFFLKKKKSNMKKKIPT